MRSAILSGLFLLALGFGYSPLNAVADPDSDETPPPAANYLFRDAGLTETSGEITDGTQSEIARNVLLVIGLSALTGVLVVPRLAAQKKRKADQSRTELAEDPSLVAFFTELRDGLHMSAPHPAVELHEPVNGVVSHTNGAGPRVATDPLQESFDSARKQIAVLRTLFSEISRARHEVARLEALAKLHHEASRLKDLSEIPELSPVWLMACGLEGLLKQLSSKLSNISPSVLGTAAGAIDLLGDLCVRGLNPNLAAEPPIRLLAVDDDAVSRLAMTFALRKAFSEPDLAPEGKTALGMAAQQTYDVIFLDVEMPGMDGFELCTKIHETILNKTTPVIFVTRHSDFNSRAKSTRCGGQHLIGKPFLSSEITVKALTVALRARLQKNTEPASLAAPSGEELSEKQKDRNSESNTATSSQPNPLSSVASNNSLATENASDQLNERKLPASFNPCSSDLAHAFFTHAPGQLEKLRGQLEQAKRATEPAQLQERLGELYVGVHSLNAQAERAELRAASRLASALEGMLKKLLEHAKYCTPSTLNAAAAALEVLEELCGQARSEPDLANPPPHILVVDDDPLTCRAIAGSIQLAFGRPDSAENGEAALALTIEKSFDLIFLDVLMPGIDGFTTCSKIHETTPNRQTPVVFVTSRDDTESRAQAIVSGGCGFIPKPVLASQITLTALTFILRARLTSPAPGPVLAPAPEPPACLAIA